MRRQQRLSRLNHPQRIGGNGILTTRSRKFEQLANDAVDALSFRLDPVERVLPIGKGQIAFPGEVRAQNVDVAQNRGKRIADLVRHAGGQLTDRCQFLRLDDLFALARQRNRHLAECRCQRSHFFGAFFGDLGIPIASRHQRRCTSQIGERSHHQLGEHEKTQP